MDTDDAIHSVHRNLQAAHERTVLDLGRGLYRNHAEFMAVAKEAERFEQDLAAMRAMMAQVRIFSESITGVKLLEPVISTSSKANADESAPKAPASPAELAPSLLGASPSCSVAALQPSASTKQQLSRIAELLPECVEFVKLSRAVLQETSAMAIYIDKQWKPAQIWLMDNGCVIASRKAKVSIMQGVKHRLTFEKIIHADELHVSDVKDTAELKNCIKLKSKGSSIFLHSDVPNVKAVIFSALSQMTHDARARKLAAPAEPKAATGTAQLAKRTHLRTASATSIGAVSKRSVLDAVLPEIAPEKEAQLRQVLEELEEAVFRLSYDEAVEHIDRVKHELSLVSFESAKVCDLRAELAALISRLLGCLFHELGDVLISRDNIAAHIQRLMVLGFAEAAQERFLANRSELIALKCRHVTYSGQIESAVRMLAGIFFDGIDVAFDWFNVSFRDPTLIAGFVGWAKNEISHFSEVFARQVFRDDISDDVIARTVDSAMDACRRLRQCGLDLGPFLSENLGCALRESLNTRAKDTWLARFEQAFAKDEFDSIVPLDRPDLPQGVIPPNTHVTESFVALLGIIMDMKKSYQKLLGGRLADFATGAVVDLVEACANKYLHAFYEADRSNTQLLNLAANYDALSGVLLGQLAGPEIASLKERMGTAADALYLMFAENAGRALALKDFAVYSQYPDGSADARLSDWLAAALPVISRISRDAQPSRRTLVLDVLCAALLAVIDAALSRQLIKFNPTGGLAQFSLDLRFLAALLKGRVSASVEGSIERIIDAVLKEASATDLERPLPDERQLTAEIIRLQNSLAKFTLDI